MMIKAIINSITPPIIKRLITILRRHLKKEINEEYFRFKDGPLKDLVFFINFQFDLGRLYLYDYDDFIYFHLEKYKSIENPVFYDIGAHFGFHTLGFSKIAGKRGKVYAFEPHPLNRERLLKNIKVNTSLCDNIIVINSAITNYKGIALFEMIMDLENGWSSNSKIIENEKDNVATHTKRHINVNTETIDNLIFQKGILKPDFIKIDVEGEEYKVLEGGVKTLSLFHPILFIEIHNIESMFLIQRFLLDLNYSLELMHKETDGRCFIKACINKLEK